ncbi:MAG: TVP38/TMEM64 family protein [Myxococcales bacterium]|nr:TVP38/TMEM64 family protein [Myxococcales bacterium]
MRRILPFVLLALVVGAVVLGRAARQEAGIEVSAESIQTWVSSLGWHAPALFVGLVTFRIFLLLPSWVVLSAGGLVFGAFLGTVLGGLGVLLSAAMGYGLARGIGRDWVRPRMQARLERHGQSLERVGPLLVGLVTAHPMGPMTVFHWAAGFATVPLLGFLMAVLLGGPTRAFIYSFFGSTLLEPGSGEFYLATTILVVVALLPLAHPGIRRRLFAARRRGTK